MPPSNAGESEVLTYIVVHREGAWWIMYGDTRAGPYETQRSACEVALAAARNNGDRVRARVWVDVPGDGMPVLYDSDE
jgi:hypothetical protein